MGWSTHPLEQFPASTIFVFVEREIDKIACLYKAIIKQTTLIFFIFLGLWERWNGYETFAEETREMIVYARERNVM